MNPAMEMIDIIYETGPLDDVDQRNQAIQQWSDNLLPADAIELLAWAKVPVFGCPRTPAIERWLPEWRHSACVHAARVGKRFHDERIREQLECLVSNPDCREAALAGLEEVASRKSLPVLAAYAQNESFRVANKIIRILSSINTPESLALLRAMQVYHVRDPRILKSIKQALESVELPPPAGIGPTNPVP